MVISQGRETRVEQVALISFISIELILSMWQYTFKQQLAMGVDFEQKDFFKTLKQKKTF